MSTIENQIDGIVVDWLEELPLDELPTDYARMIVNDFREGHMPVSEAIALLNEDCYDVMAEQAKMNLELAELISHEED